MNESTRFVQHLHKTITIKSTLPLHAVIMALMSELGHDMLVFLESLQSFRQSIVNQFGRNELSD